MSDIDQRITAHTFFINRNIASSSCRFRVEDLKGGAVRVNELRGGSQSSISVCTLDKLVVETTKQKGTIYFVKSRCSFSYPIPNFVEINIQMPNYRPNLNDIGNCPYRLKSTYASILSQPLISKLQLRFSKQAIGTVKHQFHQKLVSSICNQLQSVLSNSKQFSIGSFPRN